MLTVEFGKGFDASNLRYMRLFFQAFPNCDALRHELSWTHYRTLLRVDSATARQWYMDEAASQNWSTRALERQIGTLYYERLLASQDRVAVEQEASANILAINSNPREFVRDPVLLEFLGLPNAGSLLESDLERALMTQLQGFFAVSAIVEAMQTHQSLATRLLSDDLTRELFLGVVYDLLKQDLGGNLLTAARR